jgi:DNA-binding transcriptional ArsR family regulator
MPLPSRTQIEAAAEMLRALGDPEQLRLLPRLVEGEACVSELAEDEGEKITTVSARLKTLSVVRWSGGDARPSTSSRLLPTNTCCR